MKRAAGPFRVFLRACVLISALGLTGFACDSDSDTEGTPVAPASSSAPAAVRASPVPGSSLSAVWVNDGGEKVPREDLPGSSGRDVGNRLWDGTSVHAFAGRNEVIGFQVLLESRSGANGISVSFNELSGPDGARIASAGSDPFKWTNRNIELFYVQYLQIKGLSRLSYNVYDERHVPKKFRRPYTGEGVGSGDWKSRPDADKFYPEIAVPLESKPSFDIAANQSQAIWVDIYVPKSAAPGLYTGTLSVSEKGKATHRIPIRLDVRKYQLPDVPHSKTMVFMGYGDVNKRYVGETWPNAGTENAQRMKPIFDRHFQMARRHKLTLIDSGEGATVWTRDEPRPEWVPRLNGSLFTAAKGYDGPSVGVGIDVYPVGAYGKMTPSTEAAMRAKTNAWIKWFSANAPKTEVFWYLIDESTDYPKIEQWASWIKNNPGVGKKMKSFATLDLPAAQASVPSLDISASWISQAPASWQAAADQARAQGKSYYFYNGKRPASGSFATEDDGVALREVPWGQYKLGVSRWFFWESTYYSNYQGSGGDTNVFTTAKTFGGEAPRSATDGEAGWNYSNGDGVLFYPGTDKVYPSHSYGLNGPIASLRMKLWRRGIQDVDYIAMASAIDPARTKAIVDRMVPKAMWQYGVTDPADPTWVRSDISWSTHPDDWEKAREELSEILTRP